MVMKVIDIWDPEERRVHTDMVNRNAISSTLHLSNEMRTQGCGGSCVKMRWSSRSRAPYSRWIYHLPKNSLNKEEGNLLQPTSTQRVYSPRKAAEVDPHRRKHCVLLQRREGRKGQHHRAIENVKSTTPLHYRYMTVKPQTFQVGDVVEARCSMVFMRSNEAGRG
ncbi:uncharacterized protein EV420DRAFT_1584642 [Desarmillaria tabescens]|uniref:Uncharacterized protein n=1 Tax=Armillaria tabescens TaxID=1929756 RepID=A0AA39JA89_ARMTA|nr:uncharacterized protein EV420DRAFT_1584642 [Desarmillaria tabescens]KAK0439060.1 hypothetical protein EV420DRAFT_1584642 [Desarmillaria tabescens]